mmetsp:Transcript_19137/g.31316  ORF Transcript_19137/g.31316 Transcript_19137/m.31316 type:complete len:207 (+) Transcript_19137:2080-2700(+)
MPRLRPAADRRLGCHGDVPRSHQPLSQHYPKIRGHPNGDSGVHRGHVPQGVPDGLQPLVDPRLPGGPRVPHVRQHVHLVSALFHLQLPKLHPKLSRLRRLFPHHVYKFVPLGPACGCDGTGVVASVCGPGDVCALRTHQRGQHSVHVLLPRRLVCRERVEKRVSAGASAVRAGRRTDKGNSKHQEPAVLLYARVVCWAACGQRVRQ